MRRSILHSLKVVYIINLVEIFLLSILFVVTLFSLADAYLWNLYIVDRWDNVGSENSLALDIKDLPHISYTEKDDYYLGRYYLKYAYRDGQSWNIQTLSQYVDPTNSAGYSSSLVLDDLGQPCISYHEGYWQSVAGTLQFNTRLKYAKLNGSVWQVDTIDSVGGNPALVLDSSGKAHISYCKRYYVVVGNLIVPQADLMYAYWNGQNWQIQTVEKGGRLGEYSSLALDSEDRPHIAYREFGTADGKLKYAFWDGSTWQIQIVDDEGDAGQNPSLAINSSNSPCISYRGGDYSLRYATLNGSNWQIQTVDTRPGMYNLPNSLALDNADRPHISYYDAFHIPVSLKYAEWDGSTWNIQTIDNTNSPGLYNSLKLDSQDRPHISYYDVIDGWLKYVDAIPILMVTAPDASASEQPATDTGTFRIWRTGSTALSMTVNFTMSGTAANGTDYSTITSPVTIPAGSSSVDVALTPINNATCEGDKTAILTLSTSGENTVGTPNNATVTIHKNGCLPVVTVTATDASAAEPGTDTGTFRISRTGSTASILMVYFNISGNASDYNLIWPSLVIPAGSSFADVVLTPIDDAICKGDRMAILMLSPESSYIVGTQSSDTVIIHDDDCPPVNGICGSANGQTFMAAPTTNLCAAGTASAVTGSGPWGWNCTGLSGGATASCLANIQTYTVTFIAVINGSISGAANQTVKHGGSTTAVTAVPATGYYFTNWADSAGNIVSTSNPLTLNNVTANQTLVANFAAAPEVKVGATGFPSLQAAYDGPATANNALIKLLEGCLVGEFTAGKNITVTLQGGYNGTYNAINSYTTIQGTVLIKSGTIVMSGIAITGGL